MAEASKLSRRLSTQDASFLYNETPTGPLHIGLLQTFEGEMEFDRLVEHFERRIHLLPRYRQRLVFAPFNLAHATLEDDPEFDLRSHIKRHPLSRGVSDAEMAEAAMCANEHYCSGTVRYQPSAVMLCWKSFDRRAKNVVWNKSWSDHPAVAFLIHFPSGLRDVRVISGIAADAVDRDTGVHRPDECAADVD